MMMRTNFELETETAKPGGPSTELCVAWSHDPTYLIDDKRLRRKEPTGECSLFVRRYRLVCTPSGKLKVKVFRDVEGYPNEDRMVDAIAERSMVERPAGAAENWIPDAIRKAADDNQPL